MRAELDPADLDLIRTIADAAVDRMINSGAKLSDGRLGYPEAEAAELLGIAKHVLRDHRLSGKVRATRIGKTLVYPRCELLKLLNSE